MILESKYRVCEIIGQGGMGTVYEAEHVVTGRRVAVKVLKADQLLKKESVSRFEHEGRVVAAIRHPNICQVFDVGRLEDGSPFMVMERLRGETLADRLERDGTMPMQELCEVMVEALSALEAAHRQGVVHRDLKPDNIFVGERGGRRAVKVLDFGIAKATGLQDAAGSLTRTGMVMGTPYYMAPEQAMGERNLDRRVDVWGAGVVLYEAITGQRPFVAKNYNALLVQILTAAPKGVEELSAGVPATLAQVVRHALEKKREDRYQSAGELRQALLEVEWPGVRRPAEPAAVESRPAPVAPRGISRGTMIGAGVGAGGGRTPGERVVHKHSFSELGTEETGNPETRGDEGDEELTIVLLREDEATTIEDSDRTEVDPPSFLEEPSELGGTTAGRRR